MGIGGCLEQTKRGHGFGGSLFHLRLTRFDSHCVALKIHHLEIEIAWNALIAPPVEQNDEAVAVLRRLTVSAPAHRYAEPALPHLRDEYVLHVGLVTGNFLDKKHPVRAARFAENTWCNPRNLVSQVHLAPVLLGLADRPRRQEQRQHGHERNQRASKQQYGTNPSEERKARTEPNHHLRLAVAARKRHEHRDEKRERQQYRQIVDGGKRKQRNYALRQDLSDRRLPEQSDELRGQRYGEQRREYREREIAKFTQQSALKDHFVNGSKAVNQSDRKSKNAVLLLTSAKQTGDNPCTFPESRSSGI